MARELEDDAVSGSCYSPSNRGNYQYVEYRNSNGKQSGTSSLDLEYIAGFIQWKFSTDWNCYRE
ncbi:hypothetical protein J6590_011508 [Homalodisca vitripennis]|nr:hypothetical protein J6590_011508 [Homalodisca vitripennis]